MSQDNKMNSLNSSLSISYREVRTYSLSAQQNSFRLFPEIKLHYPISETDEDKSTDNTIFRNITVRLEVEENVLNEEIWEISQISPGQYIHLQERPLQFSHDYLNNLSDETELEFTFTVFDSENPDINIYQKSELIKILPANYWGGEERQPELLAAFVKPNGVYVESLVKHVTEVLESGGYGRRADGYQSNTRDLPYAMTAALWSVIARQKIAYVSPPPSFASQGQMIRMASNISNNKMGACLDLSLLFASCLELMGLNTMIALAKSHAFVGVWLIDNISPLLTTDDPMELRKRADSKDLVLFDATMVTNSSTPTFLQSSEYARSLISEEKETDFVYAIDIGQARARKIKPLATIEERLPESDTKDDGHITLPPLPLLPPVRKEEQQIEETPETRIDTWQRKLLDLTKRNPLLSLRDNAAAVRLYCPSIGLMEDRLADNTTFSFTSVQESPVTEEDRSSETFRFATGNDLHKEYALQQLDKNNLIANMPTKKLETTLINLFRRAKNDLEEGGANTLFIALGMLLWKENPEDERAYKAPLILIPVQLIRKSARARIKLKMLAESEPLFNLTLIEFLVTEYDIDLSYLKSDLPVDEFGVDVVGIWQIIRDAISEQPGMELLEECLVSSFSFAKYLMWRDLRDRLDDLKGNPFVAHLVDKPQEAYIQNGAFLRPEQLDDKIDPSKIFMPLNCDSSQMVAVDAGSRPQDFVLEGPPGTGKSETIANIIANNLAKGRKVLFVSEKIAALQVVYRRLQKNHLDHHILELHSNKANKKAVLDQLRRATELKPFLTPDDWSKDATELKQRRDELNTFVNSLHEPSSFGISPRQAISRVAGNKSNPHLKIDWGPELSDARIEGPEGLKKLRERARFAGIAYGDLHDIDVSICSPIKAETWSYSWQVNFLAKVKSYIDAFNDSLPTIMKFADNFGLVMDQPTLSDLSSLVALSKLVTNAQDEPIDFALGGNTRDRLIRLNELAKSKRDLDKRLEKISHDASATKLLSSPIDQWILIFEEAQNSWWKKLLVKRKINKLAKQEGYKKFSELNILYELRDAKKTAAAAAEISDEFSEYKIWKGWATQAQDLEEKKIYGDQIHSLIRESIASSKDSMALLTSIRTKLVDGRDFLEESQLVSETYALEAKLKKINQTISEAKEVGIEFSNEISLNHYSEILEQIIGNETILKPWVEWVEARKHCESEGLNIICKALESGNTSPAEIEEQSVTAFCEWLAPRLIDSREPLRRFKASQHGIRIKEFCQLDIKIAENTAAYISGLLSQVIPDIQSKEHSKEFGLLSRELQKKTRHKPIRALFQDLGMRLLDLCPCMMMSPLSVAQFLPSDFNAFDLVIFDEASQMTTWDSVGAIARGKNVVIVGDPKQMPPTNFFNAGSASADPDEEDLESVLDQALAAGLPHLRLMGHYRSRHETLIAFSNSKYYDNSLVTFPSSDTKESAVSFRKVEGVYAKGKNRNNPIEAREVVKEVVSRLLNPKSKNQSLGVVTLNSEQQRTIEDQLDDARRRYPEIEPYFQPRDDYDPVFVKNLESVQGDERDVIIFSLNYGPTEIGGKTMSMNFGPLNKSGGERRLNVAITRATTEVIIFSSFDSGMVDLSRTSALAVEHLKHYMEFAERGPQALAENSSADYGVDQFDSEFEMAVASDLRDLKWKIQTQVGVSKFRVDLGVIHPDYPGRFLAGVECDGATYHSSPNARDRDRTRQAVLENLNWKIIRLWSTNYFLDPASAIKIIHNQLNEILQNERENSPNQPELDTSNQEEIDLDKPINELVSDDDDELFIEEGAKYPSSIYFQSQHKKNLITLAKEILRDRPCITQHALALEVANLHGISRTSRKQLSHLVPLVDKWAGKLKVKGGVKVYWEDASAVQKVIPWRGLSPFGYDRTWSEIALPEAIGLAKEACIKNPENPIDYICETFNLRRRSPKTLDIFRSWIDSANESDSGAQD